jgi:Outer membrane protein beta-barrel domain
LNKSVTHGVVLALALLGTTAVTAAEPNLGFYVGGAALQSHFDSSNFDIDEVDTKDKGWKLLAGFRTTPNFGFELAYTDFGNSNAPSVVVGGPYRADAHAWSAFALGIYPAGPVDLFVKAGAARLKADGNVGAVLFEDKSTEFAYGAGVQFNAGRLGIRAEYEKFNTNVIGDLDVISLGLNFTFGGPSY